MKKLLLVAVALLILAVPACAELCQMPELSFEVPAGFQYAELERAGFYCYEDLEMGEFILGFCWYSDGENLDELTNTFVQSNGIEDPLVSIKYNKGKPFAYIGITQDGMYVQYNIMTNGKYGYAIIYGGNDDIIYYNLLSSIETGDLIGVGGYEIINTQEYFRNPFKGMGYRVYTESGRIDEEIARAIWWELYYKNVYEGTDLTTVWFYDSKSAANSGLAYGMISQDELGQEIKYEKLQ